ncbi:colicin-like pore-forming protein, partial [Escherichia coli]|uniref:colicin-like pore-forming protein n=1 Tax=Escherichia coli TaxID=562 RepID=UPI003A88CF01
VTLKMPAFEWVHVQLHQQKGMISLSPPTICNSAVTAWAFSVMLGTPVGILGFAIIMAAVSALVNDKFIEQVNKLIGI